jgi:hypothetical protein
LTELVRPIPKPYKYFQLHSRVLPIERKHLLVQISALFLQMDCSNAKSISDILRKFHAYISNTAGNWNNRQEGIRRSRCCTAHFLQHAIATHVHLGIETNKGWSCASILLAYLGRNRVLPVKRNVISLQESPSNLQQKGSWS